METQKFLWKAEKECTAHFLDSDIADDPEVKRNFTVNSVLADDVSSDTDKFITKFFNLKRLTIAIGWILKLKMISWLKVKQKKLLNTANTSISGCQLNFEFQTF